MFFSKELYVQGLKNIKTIGIGSAVTVILLNILHANDKIDSFKRVDSYVVNEKIGNVALAPATCLMVIFALIMAAAMFSFLNKRKDSDFFHSLPQKRICVYFSFVCALFTWIAGITLSTIAINSLLFITFLPISVSFEDVSIIFLFFIGYTVSAFVAAGIVTVCRMISGTGISLFFYTATAFVIPRIIFTYVVDYVRYLNPSVIISETWLDFFSIDKSFYFVFSDSRTYYSVTKDLGGFGDPLLMISLLIQAIFLFALGGLLYKSRRSELAGQGTGSKGIQLAFKTAVCLPLLFVAISNLVNGSDEASAFILLILSLLAYFLFELILSKNVKKATFGMVTFVIPLALSAVLLFSCVGIAECFRITSPKIDNIDFVTVTENVYLNKEYIECINVPMSSETVKEIFVIALENSSNQNTVPKEYESAVTVTFNLKNGDKKYKHVYFTKDDMELILREVNNILKER